jgi:hypothetical protein
MQEVVPVLLASWVLVTIGLFWRRPGRDAALISMIAGWAILPTAVYPASVFAEPIGSGGSMHALAVPTTILINKALAIGLGCLIGVVLFDWPAVRRLRPLWLDVPLIGWCLVPIAAAIANGLPLAVGLAQARYLALAWGVPYGLGRIYLGGDESLRRLGLGLVLAGLLYVPLGLLEFVHGPFLYTLVYGRQPYQFEGAARFLGHRPLVFLEHGNQLGTWSACAAVSAVWLWRSGRLPAFARVPGGVGAGGLVASCLLFQSHTAIGLMLAVLAPLVLTRRPSPLPRSAYAGMAAVALLVAVAGTTAVLAAEAGSWSGLRGKVRGAFREIGKTSFTWRLARSEEHLARVVQRPVLGWSRPDWSAAEDGRFVNPVNFGFWLSALGMFGAVGLTFSAATLLLPIGEVLRKLPASAWVHGSCSAVALTALLLALMALDSLLNGLLLLPLLAGAGGINSWSAGTNRGRERLP